MLMANPATALNILRETIMGRELFDYAFKEYSNRWKFKHPMPADFFRTMEDASGVDLDWFWRGWFFTNDHVDISLANVKSFEINKMNPVVSKAIEKEKRDAGPVNISKLRDLEMIKKVLADDDPSIIDFYSTYDPLKTNILDQEDYDNYVKNLSPKEKEILNSGKNYYELTFENKGGLVMPVIFDFVYADGTKETIRIPAEIWRRGESKSVTKVFPTTKEVVEVILDPYLETADTDRSNNYYPPREQEDKFELFKQKNMGENPMQRDRRAKEKTKVIKP